MSLLLWGIASRAELKHEREKLVIQNGHARSEAVAAGRYALARGSMDVAMSEFLRALAIPSDEDDRPLRLDVLRCRFALGDWIRLGDELRAMENGPELGVYRGPFLLLQGDYLFSESDQRARARRCVQEAIQSGRLNAVDEPFANALLAENAADRLRWLKAATEGAEDLGLRHRAHMTLATELLCQGRLDEARKQIDFVRRLFPDDPLGRLLDALHLILLGKTAEGLAAIEPLGTTLGARRADSLKAFLAAFGDLLQTLEAYDAQIQRSFLSELLLLQKSTRMILAANAAGASKQPFGFPLPTVDPLYHMWQEVVLPSLKDNRAGRYDAVIRRLEAAEKQHPEGYLLCIRASARLQEVVKAIKSGDRERERVQVEAMADEARRALDPDTPTVLPRMGLKYQCRFLQAAAEALLIQDYKDADPQRVRRMYEGLAGHIRDGRAFPEVRDFYAEKLLPGLDPDAAQFLLVEWQADARPARGESYWRATRLRASLEKRLGNPAAALRFATEVLEKFPKDGEMRRLADEIAKETEPKKSAD
jgi:hypothetical protein